MITSYYDFKHYQCPWRVIRTFFWVFCFMIFFEFLFFLLFLDFLVFLLFITAVASSLYQSLSLFAFTYRWSTVHHTWGTVSRHVRVPSSSNLPCGKLNCAVADGKILDMEHLAAWGARQGPFVLVILISSNWAPGSVSQFKRLLQENMKFNHEKANV